jgi:hypothetical protein
MVFTFENTVQLVVMHEGPCEPARISPGNAWVYGSQCVCIMTDRMLQIATNYVRCTFAIVFDDKDGHSLDDTRVVPRSWLGNIYSPNLVQLLYHSRDAKLFIHTPVDRSPGI